MSGRMWVWPEERGTLIPEAELSLPLFGPLILELENVPRKVSK